MTKVLIPTFASDIHSTAVAWALRRKGHECVIWYVNDFPTRQLASINITNEEDIRCSFSGLDLAIKDAMTEFDVVWLRRPVPPVLPDIMHEGDKIIAERECSEFLRSAMLAIAPNAFWVNSNDGMRMGERKLLQLRAAARCGLKFPKTLISNDTQEICAFIRNNDKPTVYKGFAQSKWWSGSQLAMSWATEVTENAIPDSSVMRLTPGIFQEKINKKYELRITVMGKFFITVRLNSQNIIRARADWRAAGPDLEIEPDEIPDVVKELCLDLMSELNIVFGCFDFIVTPDDEYVFLEVNQMGQFLWIEEFCPDIQILDYFTEFLIHKTPEYLGQRSCSELTYSEFSDVSTTSTDTVNMQDHQTHKYKWEVLE